MLNFLILANSVQADNKITVLDEAYKISQEVVTPRGTPSEDKQSRFEKIKQGAKGLFEKGKELKTEITAKAAGVSPDEAFEAALLIHLKDATFEKSTEGTFVTGKGVKEFGKGLLRGASAAKEKIKGLAGESKPGGTVFTKEEAIRANIFKFWFVREPIVRTTAKAIKENDVSFKKELIGPIGNLRTLTDEDEKTNYDLAQKMVNKFNTYLNDKQAQEILNKYETQSYQTTVEQLDSDLSLNGSLTNLEPGTLNGLLKVIE